MGTKSRRGGTLQVPIDSADDGAGDVSVSPRRNQRLQTEDTNK